MDTVSYICDEFAVMQRGKPAKANAKNELQILLDMKPQLEGFLEKQVKPFLQRYGRRYEWSMGNARTLRLKHEADQYLNQKTMKRRDYCHGTDDRFVIYEDSQFERCGFQTFEDKHAHRFLNASRDHNEDYYIVAINGADTGGASLMEYRGGIEYAAKLGLLAKDGNYTGIPFTSNLNGTRAQYSFDLPLNLRFSENHIQLNDAIDSCLMQFQQMFGYVSDEGRHTVIDFHLVCGGGRNAVGEHYTSYDKWVRLLDGKPDPESVNRLAASLMLYAIVCNYRFSHPRYIVDPETLLLKKSTLSNLMDALADYVINDDIYQCAYCGRPVFGRHLCRNSGCAVRYSEKMHRYAASHTCNETITAFPHIKRNTIEKYYGVESADNASV